MDPVNAIDISAAGMTAQRMRLEAAALNLANMNASSAPGVAGYRPVRAVIHAVPAPFPSLMAAAMAATSHGITGPHRCRAPARRACA